MAKPGTSAIALDLQQPHPVGNEGIALFRSSGFIKLPGVLSEGLVDLLDRRCSKIVDVPAHIRPSANAYERAFTYKMNLWPHDSKIRAVVLSRLLAELAARLLEVRAVRLSHDQALFKPPAAHETPPHADQYHWPVTGDRTVTAWIPLSDCSQEMGSLAFYEGSPGLPEDERDALCTETDPLLVRERLRLRFPLRQQVFYKGDVSFHLGWTFHQAGPNRTNRMRKAFSIVYMEDGVRLVAPRSGVPIETLRKWCPSARVGAKLDSELNPVVYSMDI